MAIIIKKGGIPDLTNGPVTATVTFYQETALPMIISNLPAGEHSIGRVELISGTVVITVSINIIVPLSLKVITEGEAVSSAIIGTATSSDGSQVTRVVEYRINDVVVSSATIALVDDLITATAYFTNGQVQTAPEILGPILVAAIDNSGTLTYTNPPTQGSLTKITAGDTSDQVIAKTYSGVVTRTPNGPITINPVLIVDGVPFVGAFSTGQVLNSIVFTATSSGAPSIEVVVTVDIVVEAVPVTPTTPMVTIDYSQGPFLGSFEYATNGDTVESILNKMEKGNPIASDGGIVTVVRKLFIGINEVQGTVKTGDVLTRATFSATAPGVDTPVVQELIFESTVLAAPTTSTGVDMNATVYGLAEVRELKTNKTITGSQWVGVYKNPRVDTLPTGVSINVVSQYLDFSSGAPSVFEGWDISDLQIRALSGCNTIFRNNIVREVSGIFTGRDVCIERNPGANFTIRKNTFIGSHGTLVYQNGGVGSVISDYAGGTTEDPTLPNPAPIEYNRFYGFGADIYKGGVGPCRRNYFGPPVNLPYKPTVYSATKTYQPNDLVWAQEHGSVFYAKVQNTGVAIPTSKVSTATWQNIDPHSDQINPRLRTLTNAQHVIENCIERNHLFGVDGEANSGVWGIGATNGVRCTGNSGDQRPVGGVTVERNLVTSGVSGVSPGMEGATQGDQPRFIPNTFRNNWIEPTNGGSLFHPASFEVGNIFEGNIAYSRDMEGGEVLPVNPGQTGTALQFTLRQSQGSFITNSTSFYRQLPYPTISKPVLTLYTSQGTEGSVDPMQIVPVTETNKTQYNPGMGVLNNALAHAAPGWDFVLAEADESGSSHVPFFEKTVVDGVADERVFQNTKVIYEAAIADHPDANKRLNVYWTTNDERMLSRWTEAMSPGYFKQYADGTPYVYGTNHLYFIGSTTTPDINAPVNASLYDFTTTSPTNKGTGVFDRTVAMDIQRLEGLSNDSTSRIAGYDAWINDPRVAATGGKPIPAASWGYYHAEPSDPDQQLYGALQYHMASFLRAANIPVDEATFGDPIFATDLSYADIPFIAGNGGILKTRRKLLNIPLPAGNTSQEVWGFELQPITGEGLFLFGRVGGAVPARYQATVTILNDTTVRITPVQPFQQGDKISFQTGFKFYRTDLKDTIEHRVLGVSKNSLSYPLEYRAELTDLTAYYPFDGFPVTVRKGPWTVPDVGTGTNTGGDGTTTTPTTSYFVTGTNGPVYLAPTNPGLGIYKVRYDIRMYIPDTVVFPNPNSKLFAQSNIGFDVRVGSTAGDVIQLSNLKDGTSTNVFTPTASRILATGIPRNTWFNMGVTANMTSNKLFHQVNSAIVTEIPFDIVSNGSFQDNRKFYIMGRADGLDTLPAGVRISHAEIYLNDVLYKRIDATNANTDSWKLATSSDATFG